MEMIYVYYAVILIILVAGIKISGVKKYNEEFLSLQQCKAVQGICAVLIIFHHMSQQVDYETPLKYFGNVGIYFVAIFFFCSGYGLIKNLRVKENYLDGFLKKRLITVLVPLYFINFIYIIYEWTAGNFDVLSGKELGMELFYQIVGLKLPCGKAWYMVVITFLYIFFYLLFKHCKEVLAFVGMAVVILAYVFLGLYRDHGEYVWWVEGEWWYNTVLIFYIGMLFARFESSIVKVLKGGYVVLLPLSAVAVVTSYNFSIWCLDNYTYYCEYDPTYTRGEIILTRLVSYSSQALTLTCFVLFILLIMLKVRVGNPILKFLGKISLEIYLIHDLFIQIFHSPTCNLQKVAQYSIAVVLCSIASSAILYFIISKVNGFLLKTKK